MERSAFARAWEYVGFAPTARWAALIGGAGSGALYVALLLLLALFADLLISQGKIPNYSDLSGAEQEAFRAGWSELSAEERASSVNALPFLADTERQRIAAAGDAARDPVSLYSLRWKAHVGRLLEGRVNASAAEAFRNAAIVHAESPAGADSERVHLGVLSFVVRSREHFMSRAMGWIASWNPWMWKPTGSAVPNWPFLLGLLILAVVVALMRFLCVAVMHHGAAQASLEAVTRIRRLIYYHTYRLGSLAAKRQGPSEAVETFTHEVETVHDGLFARLTAAVREPVKLALLLALALSLHLWLTLAFLFAVLLVWLVGRQIAVWFRRQARIGAQRAANQLVLLQESVQMMRLAKSYLMELFNQKRVERQLNEYSRAQFRRFRGETVQRPILIFLGTAAAAGLVFVAGWVALSGGLSVGNLVVLATALVSLYYPLDIWFAQRRLIRRSSEAAVAIFDFLDRRGEVGQVAGAEFLRAMMQQLDFDQVSLRETGTGRMLLDNVSFTIPAKQRVAVVGRDAAEKRALMYLIPRLLDPTSGEIRIDGKNLRWVTLDSLRNQVAIVSQQDLIFNDTVANNIGCGDPSFSIPQIIEAAKLVHAHNFIEKLPYGYETRVGEIGHSLRAGERFRIALARAMLRDPAILIIEEPEAPIDEVTRALVDDAYDRILSDRTVIFLPRRQSTLRLCQRVLLLFKGKLEADGEHRQLLQENELYRHLHHAEYNIFTEKAG